MKVLNDGTKNMVVMCHNCNSELEYDEEDILIITEVTESDKVQTQKVSRFKKAYFVSVREDKMECIECPICKNKIKLRSLDSKTYSNFIPHSCIGR